MWQDPLPQDPGQGGASLSWTRAHLGSLALHPPEAGRPQLSAHSLLGSLLGAVALSLAAELLPKARLMPPPVGHLSGPLPPDVGLQPTPLSGSGHGLWHLLCRAPWPSLVGSVHLAGNTTSLPKCLAPLAQGGSDLGRDCDTRRQ